MLEQEHIVSIPPQIYFCINIWICFPIVYLGPEHT